VSEKEPATGPRRVLPAYVITDSAFAEKERAQRRTVELNHAGYSNTGFFWIPNFEYLRGQRLFQVYVGPFRDRDEAVRAICDDDRKLGREAYGILVSTRPGREAFRCCEQVSLGR